MALANGMRHGPFLFLALLAACLCGCASGPKTFSPNHAAQIRNHVTATFNSAGAFSSKSDLGGETESLLGAKTWSFLNGSDPWWIVQTDEDGQVRRYGLDAFGRTNQIQEVDGSANYTTALKYGVAGDLTNIVNANSENIYFAYNDLGDMVAMADPNLGQWTYVRDYAGRVRVQTDARGTWSPIRT